jgi:hypothetical protein
MSRIGTRYSIIARGSGATIASFCVAIASAVMVPDGRYGELSIAVIFGLAPFLIALPPVLVWATQPSGLMLWKMLVVVISALTLHFLLALNIYTAPLRAPHLDGVTNAVLAIEILADLVVSAFVVVGGLAYKRLSQDRTPLTEGHTSKGRGL